MPGFDERKRPHQNVLFFISSEAIFHLKQYFGTCGKAYNQNECRNDIRKILGLLNELVSVDSNERADFFLKEPEFREARYYFLCEGLKSLKKNQQRHPETLSLRYLVVNLMKNQDI